MERDKERLVNQIPPPTLVERIREKLIMVGIMVGLSVTIGQSLLNERIFG